MAAAQVLALTALDVLTDEPLRDAAGRFRAADGGIRVRVADSRRASRPARLSPARHAALSAARLTPSSEIAKVLQLKLLARI